jgi:GT2 family glycosyltransferase
MSSIAPVNPQSPGDAKMAPANPAVWLNAPAATKPAAEGLDPLAALDWPRWAPASPMRNGQLGRVLAAYASACPNRPLLMTTPGLMLRAQDARRLAALAGRQQGAVVLTVLSNARQRFNPFAGLDTSRLQSTDGRDQASLFERTAALVALLGGGRLHTLDDWPGHLLYLSPQAVQVLASDLVTTANARVHLRRHGGRLLVAESLFAQDLNRALDHGPELQPHEERRPAAWGDLTASLARWLADAVRLPERAAADDAPATLHITHSWGGGVAQWVRSYIDADQHGRHFQLRSEGPQTGFGAGQRLALYAGNELAAPLAVWWLNPPVRSSCEDSPHYRQILEAVTRRHGIGRIILSSLVGHSLDALRSGLPTLQVLHDFYPAWPLLGVHPEPFISLDREVRLQQAMHQHALLPDFGDRDAAAWNRLADVWFDTVAGNGVSLVAPSASVGQVLRQLDSRWRKVEIHTIPHGLEPFPGAPAVEPRCRPDGKLRLVIPGRMQQGKGQSLLQAALPGLVPHAHIYLLGAGKHGEAFFGQPGVNVILQYDREDLPRLMQTIGADAAALLSIVPETFSYTLSEMQQLGVPVIATRVGSLAERIHDGRDGWLIEPTAESLIEVIRELAANRQLLHEVRSRLRGVEHFSSAAMVGRYDALCPALRNDPQVDAEPGLSDLQLAALAEQHARLQAQKRAGEQHARALQAEIERRTEWAVEQQQALAEERQARDRWVHSLEQQLQEVRQQRDRWVQSLEQDLKSEQQQRDRWVQSLESTIRQQHEEWQAKYLALVQSSSWRITKPLRAGRRVLDNLARARAWNPARWPLLASQAIRTLATQGLRGALLRVQQSPQSGLFAAPALQPAGQDTAPVGQQQAPLSVPRASRPAVSIVIPVYNQWDYTAACLASIAAARNEAGFEVIVVDDQSQDQTAQRLARIDGLQLICNPQNVGFVGSCNRGAEAAAGEYILLLNNDTRVQDGWLDALLETFARFPDTGLAGARLVYPDGRLQEAGGIVFRDGSGWNYGRGDRADKPEYNFTREADYCSGACIMLPAPLFRQLGGFDARYAPAYYEDTDLAFRVREAGFRVRVQPAATIIHYEGITSGTDIGRGTKRYQQVNRAKFLDRWRERLADYPQPVQDPGDAAAVRRARDHRLRGRVLIIDAYTPEPDQDSGSLRLRYLFDCFQRLGYGVSFFADNRAYAGQYSSELQRGGVEVIYNPWLESLQDFFRERGADFDLVMICRHYVAVNYLALLQKYCPAARFIFDTVDLHYLREQRLAALENSLPLQRVAAQTRRSELAVVRQAAATLVVSPVEQAVLAEDAPQSRVHVLSNIHRISARPAGFADRKDIFFVGGYQHPPNVDAALWFVGSIWPLIQQQVPAMRFHLIGSKAPEKVRALHGNGVEFHGYVKDLQPWLDGCRLAVAPLRYGAGVKGKVNLSMSQGQPVVATPMAVEGLYAQHGKDVLIAETAQDFAAAVLRLYQDESLWTRLSEGGQENVRQHFSFDCALQSLAELLQSLQQA